MAAYAGYRDPGQGDSLMAKKMAAQHRAAGGTNATNATNGSLSARSQASAHRTVAMALEKSPESSPRQPEPEELAQTQSTLPSIRHARTRDVDRWKFSERKHLREMSEIKTRSDFAEGKYTIPFCEAHSLHIARGDKIDDETAAEILDYYYTELAPSLGPGLPGQNTSQRHRQPQSSSDELDADTLRQLEELDTEFVSKKNRIQDKYGAKRKQNYCLATDYRQLMEASRGIPMHYSSKNVSREGDGLTDAGDEPPVVYEELRAEVVEVAADRGAEKVEEEAEREELQIAAPPGAQAQAYDPADEEDAVF